MKDESSKLGASEIAILILILLALVGALGWFFYSGPIPFGKQHPTLHDAVGAGNIKDAKSYVAEDNSLIESRDSHGELPIHHAIKYRQADALRFLIDQGANVDGQVLRSGDAPLHFAVMMGDEAAIRLLLTSGADYVAKNNCGETPLDLARKHTYSNVEKIIGLLTTEEEKGEPEQGVAPQSATRFESDSEGGDKPQPESEARSR